MKQKYLLILGIVVVLSIILISGCIQEKTEQPPSGMYVKTAVPIFYSNITVDSDSKAQQIFDENFEEIIEVVETKLEKDDYFIRHYSGLKLTCIENNILLSTYPKFEKRKFEYFSTHWVGDFEEEKYTFVVPIAPKDKEWKYENEKVLIKDVKCEGMPSGQSMMIPIEMANASYDELKEYLSNNCEKGIVETWIALGYNLRFIMDSNGTIYMAGSYCPK